MPDLYGELRHIIDEQNESKLINWLDRFPENDINNITANGLSALWWAMHPPGKPPSIQIIRLLLQSERVNPKTKYSDYELINFSLPKEFQLAMSVVQGYKLHTQFVFAGSNTVYAAHNSQKYFTKSFQDSLYQSISKLYKRYSAHIDTHYSITSELQANEHLHDKSSVQSVTRFLHSIKKHCFLECYLDDEHSTILSFTDILNLIWYALNALKSIEFTNYSTLKLQDIKEKENKLIHFLAANQIPWTDNQHLYWFNLLYQIVSILENVHDDVTVPTYLPFALTSIADSKFSATDGTQLEYEFALPDAPKLELGLEKQLSSYLSDNKDPLIIENGDFRGYNLSKIDFSQIRFKNCDLRLTQIHENLSLQADSLLNNTIDFMFSALSINSNNLNALQAYLNHDNFLKYPNTKYLNLTTVYSNKNIIAQSEWCSLLHTLVIKKNKAMIDVLINHPRFKPTNFGLQLPNSKLTPLHLAFIQGDVEIARSFLQHPDFHNSYLKITDVHGRVALDYLNNQYFKFLEIPLDQKVQLKELVEYYTTTRSYSVLIKKSEPNNRYQQALNLLKDYVKYDAFSPKCMLFFTGHWNRHHLQEVNKLLDNLKASNNNSIDTLLQDLESINLVNSQGSLARRIQFIKKQIVQNNFQHSNTTPSL